MGEKVCCDNYEFGGNTRMMLSAIGRGVYVRNN
jgi:hypothetical protein